MTFVRIANGTIETVRNRLPRTGTRLDTGQDVSAGDYWTQELHEACGWFEVPAHDPQPADIPGEVWELGPVTLTPTTKRPRKRVWTSRPLTQDELDAETDEAERAQVRGLLPQIRDIAQSGPFQSPGGNTNSKINALIAEAQQARDDRVLLARALRHVTRDALGD